MTLILAEHLPFEKVGPNSCEEEEDEDGDEVQTGNI
jgi:hypothetical protein